MSFLRHSSRLVIAALIPLGEKENDIISKDTKTYKAFLERRPTNETGLDRVKEMFKVDEFGTISPELNSVYQAGFCGFLFGAIYGGFINSRTAYEDFMNNNQASAFKSHLDAKRKLQNEFTVSFAKGAFKWGWRVSLFTTSYFGIITLISVYREKSSIYEYLAAGGITGSLYKVNMGLRGMTAGGIIGAGLGGIAGLASLGVLKLSGYSMEEMRYWQYKWRLERDENIREAYINQQEDKNPVVIHHDAKLGEAGQTISLDSVN
ncbi:RPII140-upstream gene protein [Episyrphus balteatus]|uniref:RPII140-upstream gene protein n=1 Tax=Episyrphus balteatus TaxID=286459 RepID=UPI002486185E|nr:RPII140-upstream gene protein [Episyrphus balteatus]